MRKIQGLKWGLPVLEELMNPIEPHSGSYRESEKNPDLRYEGAWVSILLRTFLNNKGHARQRKSLPISHLQIKMLIFQTIKNACLLVAFNASENAKDLLKPICSTPEHKITQMQSTRIKNELAESLQA